ncbi:DUF4043 family protein [Xanthobacter sp. VNH20]|uniref:phage capsid family protein n=1 Tax=Xanthobacter sp. VNH20 TaxID=3156616 RepID=UPI0032B3E174
MALTTIQSNNKLVKFRQDITLEYFQGNQFSPYMGDSPTSIIQRINDLKAGGEQVNIPLVTQLDGDGVGTGTLVGNEENIDNYGMRLWIDWARNAVKTNKAETQKTSADIFGKATPLLSNWGKRKQRDELILAMHALPSASPPAGLGSNAGQRVNGILYSAATAAQKNTWNTANSDRVLYGNAVGNYVSGNHASSLANIDATDDRAKASTLGLLKDIAESANPHITPYMTEDGYEHYVLFVGSRVFRDFKADPTIYAANRDARAREGRGMDSNPIFQDGDLLYDGVIIRKIPQMDGLTTVASAGASSIAVAPIFLCGQSAVGFAWGQMPRPTQLDETDYGFNKGVGVEMAYGIGKLAKVPEGGSALKDWGMVTGYLASIPNA